MLRQNGYQALDLQRSLESEAIGTILFVATEAVEELAAQQRQELEG